MNNHSDDRTRAKASAGPKLLAAAQPSFMIYWRIARVQVHNRNIRGVCHCRSHRYFADDTAIYGCRNFGDRSRIK